MTKRTEEIFRAAVNLSQENRNAFLDHACGADVSLRDEVETLLESNAQTDALPARSEHATSDFDDTIPHVNDESESAAHRHPGRAERPGAMIDRYKLLQQIGEGGFGTVWMAEQREPVKRRVALKVIKFGMDTKQVIARFEAERQALAMMDHPNIAKVLDAGATEAGRPYFVMELVRGVPIIEYCDREKLDTHNRLELFINVCHAIQHAHQKGVIHRDIKPSNVLVTLHDGLPVPKVIDFGIAKATNTELTQKTLFTEFQQMIGTPAYMSPEQAEMSGLDIDTRSDIYSLGVLLYELLTGTTPFDSQALMSRGYAEMMRIIREEEPHRPSTRLSSLGETATPTAERRRTDVGRLNSLLRGDLDWIVMKCLEKDRTRRYDTANALADDIERHLHDEPVQAGPPGAGYRLRKFVKRNRGQVIAACAVAGALALGMTGTTIGLFWALDERANAQTVAEAEAARNELALQGLLDILKARGLVESTGLRPGKSADLIPATSNDLILTLQQAEDGAISVQPRWVDDTRTENPRDKMIKLLASEAAYQTQLAIDQERQRADELQTVADFQASQLGAIDARQMGEMLRRELFEAVPEAQHSELAPYLDSVNFTSLALQSLDQNIFAQTLTAIDNQFADQPQIRALLQQAMAKTLRSVGLLDRASGPQHQALDTRRELLGATHPLTLESIAETGTLLHSQGRLAEAEPYLREAMTGYREVSGPDGYETLNAANSLGFLLKDMGRFEEAEALYREAYEGCRRTLGEDDPDTLSALNNLGSLMQSMGRMDEAESCYRKVLDARRRVLGDDHPDTMVSVSNLGFFLMSRREYGDAEPYFKEALADARQRYGNEHAETIISITNMGALYWLSGQYDQAEPYWTEALEASRRALGDLHPNTLDAINNMGMLRRSQGRPAEAAPFFQEAYAGRSRVLGDLHPNTLTSIGRLADVLIELDRFAEAEPLCLESEQRCRDALGDVDPKTIAAVERLSRLYEKWHEAEPGARHDAKAATWRERLEAIRRSETREGG